MRKPITVCVVCLAVSAFTFAQEGRWKLGGDGSCYWDAYDEGPNQCEPGVQPEPVPPDEPMNAVEEDIQRLGETSEELLAFGFNDPYVVNEETMPTIIEVFERHSLWDGMPSHEARELLNDGVYARRNGIIVGHAVPRMEAIQFINPKLRFPQPNGYIPKHPVPPPALEDCWVMKKKASLLKDLSRKLAESALLITTAGGILKGTIPSETPIKKLPMLSRFLEPLAIGGAVTGMGSMIAGWMSSEYSFAPCLAQGEKSWKTPSGIKAANDSILATPTPLLQERSVGFSCVDTH